MTKRRPDLTVYIPTRGRIGWIRQPTLRDFLEYSSIRPVLVCPEDEYLAHKEYYRNVVACPLKGIGPTRQFILETSEADVICMVSDDMRFCYRPEVTVPKLDRCRDLDPMLTLIEDYVSEGFIHGGIGARQGNNRKLANTPRKGVFVNNHLIMDCERVNDFHFLDRRKVLKTKVRFDQLTVMEDFHYTLSLLRQAWPNRVIHDYVWNQEASGKEGGCSLYRTNDVQTQGAIGLKKAFPKYVELKKKKSKDTSTSWQDMKVRMDVKVYWTKAYWDGVREHGIRMKCHAQ